MIAWTRSVLAGAFIAAPAFLGAPSSAHARKPPLVTNAPVSTTRYWVVSLRLRGRAVQVTAVRAQATRRDRPLKLFAMAGPYRIVALGEGGRVLAKHEVSFPLLGLAEDDERFRAGLSAETEARVPHPKGLRAFRVEDGAGQKLHEHAARWPVGLREGEPPAPRVDDED